VLVLKNGWVLVAYEANAKPDENKSSVQILLSKDTCKTWEGPVIYITGRSWEPAMVELPNGEIELFYSSEAKWWPNEPIYQEIMQIYSTDKGYSWSQPRTVAYYP
jgi:Neuraminidase (sialidase)